MSGEMSKKKQSIIAGGLISSAGIFVSKLIGLIYVVPFNAILQTSANQQFYGVAYQIYSYILNISIAGFPYAIATLVARYASRGDYKTSMLIKKISTITMAVFGLLSMLFLIAFSGVLAPTMIAKGSSAEDIEIMRNVLIVISFALFFVPVLSGLRGFYQGLKEMEVYALSQVLEQITRVIFLLSASAIAVYLLNQDRVWAVYFGVLSASVAALLAIVHIKFYDRRRMRMIRKKAKEQEVADNHDKGILFKELVYIAFPYLIAAVLGYSDSMINLLFLSRGLSAYGFDVATSETIVGAITLGVNKLLSIPMILAPGFSAAIIPYITSARAKNDRKMIRKHIRDCVDTVLYIGIPVSFCLMAFAKPIYFILFDPKEQLDLCASILSWYSLEAFISTISPVFTSLMMAVGLQKINLRNMLISTILKLILTYPMIAWLGYSGAVISSFISMGAFALMDIYALKKHHQVVWTYTLRKMLIMAIGIVGIAVVAYLFDLLGLKGYGAGKIKALLELAISGSAAVAAYVGITALFQLPQTIFHLDAAALKKRMKRS